MHTIRRVVTGHGSNGKSKVIIDAPADTVIDMGFNCRVIELWATHEAKPTNLGNDDAALKSPLVRTPPPFGDKFRIIEFAPDEQVDHEVANRHMAERMSAGRMLGSVKEHLHRSETIDYVIVVKGEISHLTESDEVLLKQGDVLIQRGTYHAWRNRSKQPALIAVILRDAQPLEPPSAPATA